MSVSERSEMNDQVLNLHDIRNYDEIKAAQWTWPVVWALLLYAGLLLVSFVSFPEFKKKSPERFVKAQVVQLPAEEKPKKVLEKPKPKKTPPKPPEKERLEKPKTKEKPKPPPKVEKPKVKQKPKEDPKIERKKAKVEKHQQEWLEQQWASTLTELDEEVEVEAEVMERAAATHIQAIQAQVSKYWQYPPSARRAMEVVLEIKLIPTGEVIDVKVVHSSGNVALDRSARQALVKASPLPVPDDIRLFEKYFRTLTMPFRPEDARL